MTRSAILALLAALLAGPALAQAPRPLDDAARRDETARLAVAVLGQVCLLNLGDTAAALAATAPGGEFGFVEAPPEVAKPLLGEREGFVRVLRRATLGAVAVVLPRAGGCAVWAEYADALALRRHLGAMVDQGGLKGGATLQPMGASTADGVALTDFSLLPTGWYARQLARRLGGDGLAGIPLVSAVAPPGRAPMEVMLSVGLPAPTR